MESGNALPGAVVAALATSTLLTSLGTNTNNPAHSERAPNGLGEKYAPGMSPVSTIPYGVGVARNV